MDKKSYKCNICEKIYSSYKSLWNHNNKFHNTNELINNFNCSYCNKNFNDRSNKYKHEKYHCKKKKTNENITELKKEIAELKRNINCTKNINHGTINNTQNNNITINAFGNENIYKLSINDIKKLALQDKNAIIYIVDLLNFNNNYPENHNFCTTSLEGDYVNVYNKKTNKIDKINKIEFFDKILLNSIQKINDVICITEFDKEKMIDSKYITKLENSVTGTDIYNTKNKKLYNKNINQLSYNKKNMILNTWASLKEEENENSDSEFTIISYLSASDSDDDELK